MCLGAVSLVYLKALFPKLAIDFEDLKPRRNKVTASISLLQYDSENQHHITYWKFRVQTVSASFSHSLPLSFFSALATLMRGKLSLSFEIKNSCLTTLVKEMV